MDDEKKSKELIRKKRLRVESNSSSGSNEDLNLGLDIELNLPPNFIPLPSRNKENAFTKQLTYKIPSKIYQKAQDELQEVPNIVTFEMRKRCHQNIYRQLNTIKQVDCNANILEACKQALEDRNFRILYDIISKALEIRCTFLTQQLLEYMEAAIMIDPKIRNKEETLSNFISRVRQLNISQEEYLSLQHTLTKKSDKLED